MSKRKNTVALRPNPTDQERSAIVLATERVLARPVSPAVLCQMKPLLDDGSLPQLEVMPAHTDGPGWGNQLKDTFGTRSADFASLETDRLASALGLHNGNAQGKINAALAAMTAAQPKDEMEAMLASQMVATHALVMDLLQRTKQAKDRQLLDPMGD